MKKNLQILLAAVIGAGAFFFAEINTSLFLGAIIGASILFIISAIIGERIMRTYVSHLEKRERDYLLDLQQTVEKDQYE